MQEVPRRVAPGETSYLEILEFLYQDASEQGTEQEPVSLLTRGLEIAIFSRNSQGVAWAVSRPPDG